jgi:hypothetical protein
VREEYAAQGNFGRGTMAMNPQSLLLAHFNHVTDGPNAIPRLRRFIFDLAVRGKQSCLLDLNPLQKFHCMVWLGIACSRSRVG